MTQNTVECNGNIDVRNQMSEYWNANKAEMTEMMQDSKANEMSDPEMREIFKFLPEFQGKDVLEPACGIGRFTSKLAENARSVIAVDFIEKFTEKNKEINGHRKNVTILCKNVLDVELEENSLDLIFVNWLFMYLTDEETRVLVDRMLRWLRPTGQLFSRETCYRPSGDKPRVFNPTIYRSPNDYTNLFCSVVHKAADKAYGFDLVTSKSVETYILMKDNPNEICWLMVPAERDSAEYQGYETFQKYLEHKQYSMNEILRYEVMFGRDYISTGGHTTTKELCTMLDLKKGDQVLDVGCGIGGSAFHMSREYGAEVIGIDLSSGIIGIAIERQREYQIPKVYFKVEDATKVVYPVDAFDVVYSRDTILHIKRKDLLFGNCYKWLKAGGKVLITDYVCGPYEHLSQGFRDYAQQKGYNLLTMEEYTKEIENAGFSSVKAIDKSQSFMNTLTNELEAFGKKKEEFLKKFSVEDYDAIVEDWNAKLRRCAKGDQKWGLFYAEKSE